MKNTGASGIVHRSTILVFQYCKCTILVHPVLYMYDTGNTSIAAGCFILSATTYKKFCANDSIFAPRRCEMKKLQSAVAQFECYSKGEKTKSDFIKCLGYKFGAVI